MNMWKQYKTLLSPSTSVLVTIELANGFPLNFVRASCKLSSSLYFTFQFNRHSNTDMTVSEEKMPINSEILFGNISIKSKYQHDIW
jgi:hypothetical protein